MARKGRKEEMRSGLNMKGEDTFHLRVIRIIRKIPRGKVAAYGQIAALAGDPRAARQVVRTLHSSTEKNKLPWHRVVNGKGTISLPRGHGYELQKALLESEGVAFGAGDKIDFGRHLWKGPRKTAKKSKAKSTDKSGKKNRCARGNDGLC